MMATGYPDYSGLVITSAPNMEQKKVSVTDTEVSVTFSQPVKSWLVYNDGPAPVHFSTTSGVSTNNFKIPSGSYYGVDLNVTKLYFICPTGKTATVYVVAVY